MFNGNGDPRPPARRRPAWRIHYPNLSFTRAPVSKAEVALWPPWTDIPVEDLDWEAFDAFGYPRGGGQ
jgi:hypothetical protein